MREREIFIEALERDSPTERAAVLDEKCGGDQALRRNVEQLLAEHERAESFILDSPPAELDPTVVSSFTERPGTIIGPYKLLQQVGEGGMGVVFMAEQAAPIKRTVALKIIKPGMDTRQVIARFEAERQALAMMDHPNIAKVLDAGTTASGRPYFVMELVKGISITRFCDEKRLSVRDRLDLFLPVCHAVQHAHQKGVIHRDIKPSNVLVAEYDDRPIPKIIDFGVAKATAHRLTERTMFTEFGQVIGTVEYMSPEQAKLNQLDIDTRSDIYSLGVLLYEFLTGSTPFEQKRLQEVAFDEMLRIIREEDPLKPSTKVSANDTLPTIATNRHTEPARLSKEVHGELDWIVMKCLEKDRNRRYETASGLAADIERYLYDEAVEAGPPSAAYRFRKFARRNKKTLTTAILMSTALLLAVGSLGWSMRDRAARRFLLEQQITQALAATQDWYERAKMPEALATFQRAEDLLASGSGVRKELRRRVRQWHTDLEMAALLEQISLARTAVRNEAFDDAGADRAYQDAFRNYGVDVEAMDQAEVASLIRAAGIKDALVIALDDWAFTKTGSGRQKLLRLGQVVDADSWRNRFRRGVEIGELQLHGVRMEEILAQPAATINLLGRALGSNGHPQAVPLLLRAQQRYPSDFWINHHLATYLRLLKPPQTDKAIGFFRAAVALRPESPGAYVNLAAALQEQGQIDEAIAANRRAIKLKPDYATPFQNLSTLLRRQGNLNEAVAAARRVLELKPDYADTYLSLGTALSAQGKMDDAVAAFRKAIELQPNHAVAYNNLGNELASLGKQDEAIVAYNKAIELDYELAHANLGSLLHDQGKLSEAVTALRKAIELKSEHPLIFLNLAHALKSQGKWGQWLAAIREAEKHLSDNRDREAVATALSEEIWSLLHHVDPKLRDPNWARELAGKAVALDPQNSLNWRVLGWAYYRVGDWQASLEAIDKSCKLQDNGEDAFQSFLRAMAHWQLGHREKARKWYDKAVENEKEWPHDLQRFRAEAVELLGVEVESSSSNVGDAQK